VYGKLKEVKKEMREDQEQLKEEMLAKRTWKEGGDIEQCLTVNQKQLKKTLKN
jgi:hypothetical protein